MKQKSGSGQEIWNDASLSASRWQSDVSPLRGGAEQSDSTACLQKNQISKIKFVCKGQTWCSGVLQPLLHVAILALMSITQHWIIIVLILWSWTLWNIHALPTRSHTLDIIHMQNEPSATVMTMEAFCQDVRHLRKCCLSVTVGISRRNFAVRHLVISAAAATRCVDLPAKL